MRNKRMQKLTFEVEVPCGSGNHKVSLELTQQGEVRIFSPCHLLPETARRMAGCTCTDHAFKTIFEQILKMISKCGNRKQEKYLLITVVCYILDNSDDEYLRYEVAKALGEIKDAQALPSLVRALHDENRWVRFAAAKALGKFSGFKGVVEPLIEALKDEFSWVRYAAAKGLGDLGDPKAFEVLKSLRGDEDEYVRRAAEEALAKITKGSGKKKHGR